MPRWTIILIVLILTACTSATPSEIKPTPAQAGKLDLTHWDFEKQGSVPLDGMWELYWNQLLTPTDFRPPPPQKTADVPVPGQWTAYKINGQSLPGHGYGTFRLIIQTNDQTGQQLYGLKLGDVGTAYRLWLNGQNILTDGVVGTTLQTTVPRNNRQVVYFTLHQPTIELIIQVANFEDQRGGIWRTTYLGLAKDIARQREKALALNLFLFGSLLVMGLYHFGLYSLRRKDTHTLYFGLFCIMIALRTIVMGENFLSILLPNLSWEILIRLEYAGFYFAMPMFMAFMQALYPYDFSHRLLIKFLQWLGICFGGLVLITPPYFLTETLLYFQLITLVACIYLIYGLLKAIINQREGALIIGLGQLIFIGTAINDILYANSIIHTGFLVSFGLLIFILLQSLTLSMRLARTFANVESLSEQLGNLHYELATTNAELATANADLQAYSQTMEQRVEQRTADLTKTNEQLTKEIVERKQAQQETAIFAQVVRHIGYALIDRDLTVLSSNPLFNQWVEEKPDTIVGLPLNEVFVELVGFEDALQLLFSQPHERLTLARIYRPSEREQGDFFTLEFELLYASQDVLLAMVTDETAHTYLEGQFKQERNELRLNIIQREQAEAALREAHQTLERRVDELSTLNLITQTVSTVLDLKLALSTVAKEMNIIFKARSTGIAMFKDSTTELTVVAYCSTDSREPSSLGVKIPVENNPSTQYVLTTRQPLNITAPQTDPLTAPIHALMRERNTQSLLIIPMISRGEVFGTIGIDSAELGYSFTPHQIALAETITGQIAGVVENARLFEKVQQANIRMQDELNLARKIQYGLLPPTQYKDDYLTIICHTMPVNEVGGDFYQYRALGIKRKQEKVSSTNEKPLTPYCVLPTPYSCYGIAVGDVSGKGVSAALLMATTLAQLDSHLAHGLSSIEMMMALDKAMMPYTKSRRQNCALCYMEIEVKGEELGMRNEELISDSSLLRVVNAGGIPPYIKRTTGEAEEVEIGGFAVGQGLGAEIGYQQVTLNLAKGDLVILTSDGIVEANNKAGEMLGFERLKQIISDCPTTQADGMLVYLKQEILAFTGGAEQHDDMTIVVAQV